ncbi:ABC transporter substrate-binding protein [Microbacterium sp. STN6]|uniref:ABC transporter substrate-binding protein n=1 Tax=Microbacterium sp. STN6 TaxID=2995588 RepID=UPI002260C684|nr:ABC transporter substrate-binding protein [Microbacterium sp. STN6]MCX7521014.1 ABC transporter substrate-binding protein [Microbacterium sp. STN6]
MKKITVAGIAALTALALAGCSGGVGSGGSGGSGGTILVGGIAGTSGAYGTTGQAAFNGAELAIDEINSSGTVLGKKLKFQGYDDGADATKASQLFSKLQSQGAVAILGSPDQGPTVAALADQKKFPVLGPVDDAGLSIYPNGPEADPYAWAWSTSLNTFAWGEKLGEYALKNCTGLAVLHDPSGYGMGGLAGIKLAYDAAGKKLALDESITENWSTGATVGLKAEIRKIKQSGADCVDVWLTPQDQASFMQEAQTEGADFTFLGNDETCSDTTFSGLAKKQGDGMICALITTDMNPNARLSTFRDDYKKKFGVDATAFAELTYDAVYILKKAIEEGKSTEPESLRTQLNKITNFDGLTGSLTFTEKQHSTLTTDQLTVVRYDAASDAWVAVD